jgi:hypothetical protein
MSEFISQPPSKKRNSIGKLFRGGMMPATPTDMTALILIDIRSLKLSAQEGKKLEAAIREFLFQELERQKIDLKDRSAIDLSSSVFGVAIE